MQIHSLKSLIPAALLACLAALPAQGWSDAFTRPGVLGRVFAVGNYNGQLVAGGLGLETRGGQLGNLARWDGNTWQQIGDEVKGEVRAIGTYKGDLVIAGSFGAIGSLLVDGIARWDGTRWHAMPGGPQLSYAVRPTLFALTEFAGELYVGGRFDRLGTRPVVGLARWNGSRWADVAGSVQGSWEPQVLSLLVSNQRLYVGGTFDRAGSVAAANIASFDGTTWSGVGGGTPGALSTAVWALEEFGGRIYAGGNFRTAGTTPVLKIAAFDGRTWSDVGGGFPDWSISSTVYSLRRFGNRLYIGGNFINGGNTASRAVIAWDGQQFQPLGGVTGSDLKTTVIDMAVVGQQLVVGGEFTRAGLQLGVGQAVVSTCIAGFDGTGWSQIGKGLGMSAEPRDLVRYGGGVVAVGRFIEAGSSLSSQVAWFDGRDWRHIGTFDNNVQGAIVFQGDLVVTGDFTKINGQSMSGTARYDGSAWHPMTGAGGSSLAIYRGELYGGGLGHVKRWTGQAWVSLGSLFGQVYDMREYGGLLYIGGSSLLAPSVPGSPNLVAWDGTRFVDAGGGTDKAVESLAVFANQLVVGGRFTTVGGNTPARNIATFDGRTWAQLGPGLGSTVHSLAVLRGSLYVGGSFNTYTRDPVDYIARFNGTGWSSLGGGIGGAPLALAADEEAGELWVGGLFARCDAAIRGGLPARYMARWSVSSRWADLGSALAGTFGEPRLIGHGELRANEQVTLRVHGGPPRSQAFLAFGLQRIDLPFSGGTLVPDPAVLLALTTDSFGALGLGITVPGGIPQGTRIYLQSWLADGGAPFGLAATNGLLGVAR